MEEWLRRRPVFLDESLRHDGLGDAWCGVGLCPDCSTCPAQYRCKDCFEGIMRCSACIVSFHRNLPLHRVQVRKVFCAELTRANSTQVLERRLLRKSNPRKPRARHQPHSPRRHLPCWARDPLNHCHRSFWPPYCLRPILHVFLQLILGTLLPITESWLVPGIGTPAQDGLHVRSFGHLSQNIIAGEIESVRLLHCNHAENRQPWPFEG